ncbi:MAG: glycosyl hydrolase 115 family protein [Muribaculaceae bacterium]|nr:glycosyl hydrolase 115 family protein [Muribaculaceae bacterium]
MKILRIFLLPICGICSLAATAIDHSGITSDHLAADRFTLIENNEPTPIVVADAENSAVRIAAANLAADFGRVGGVEAVVSDSPTGKRVIMAGTFDGPTLRALAKAGKVDVAALKGKREKYVISFVQNPAPGVEEALVVAGSDRRGAVYGIYELSEQLGVSPWYDWADAPVAHRDNASIKRGVYTAGEPAVQYRGIFLNDEAPCLSSWVKNTYGTDYGDHRFYGRVFELILRLRGNFMWPAMWMWSFYADDPENSATADAMGVIMGTSHHEPMARNHQEWARKRKEYGKWNYASNQQMIDGFFREGIRRAKDTEDVVTIGMRGDGDEAMSEDADVALLEKIISNQRRIIAEETGRKAKETPQVWALYKEVLDYYDKGLRVPDDVIMLVCDDNWGNVRRLPDAKERKHPGGWGMYYHVDYVGAPRNSKWLNMTPIQGMWEQLRLTYDYGVDRLWILNVGDLKPMEYPITLFLDMAWNPTRYNADNFMEHSVEFCNGIFGEKHGAEAARILNLYSKYNGRVTAEMLDASTYNINNGEWRRVADEYARLEAEALRLYMELPEEARDAFFELVLFPVQAMSNLYEMYYAQAMNLKLSAAGDPVANDWADRAERCFRRDAELADAYNNKTAGGKWRGMMTQKHIGYTSWNDNFPADTLPELHRVETTDRASGGYASQAAKGVAVIEAEHFYAADAAAGTKWTVIPDMGRTLGGVALMPYTETTDGASLTYKIIAPEAGVDSVDVHVVVKSTLDFLHIGGHTYRVALDGCEPAVVNFNSDLNESPENIYTKFYPTVARRVVEKVVRLPLGSGNEHMLTLQPMAPGIVFEKIILDFGGYEPSYLFMDETPYGKADVTR